MKMYEKMGIDLMTKEGIAKLLSCTENCRKGYNSACDDPNCPDCWAEYLYSDVPTKIVKRWETYNGDFVKARAEFNNFCKEEYTKNGCGSCSSCSSCSYSRNFSENCFATWLMEEIELEVY